MTDLDPFLLAALDGDATALPALADYLEERGDPRAEAVRGCGRVEVRPERWGAQPLYLVRLAPGAPPSWVHVVGGSAVTQADALEVLTPDEQRRWQLECRLAELADARRRAGSES
jgi:hypothetical protein